MEPPDPDEQTNKEEVISPRLSKSREESAFRSILKAIRTVFVSGPSISGPFADSLDTIFNNISRPRFIRFKDSLEHATVQAFGSQYGYKHTADQLTPSAVLGELSLCAVRTLSDVEIKTQQDIQEGGFWTRFLRWAEEGQGMQDAREKAFSGIFEWTHNGRVKVLAFAQTQAGLALQAGLFQPGGLRDKIIEGFRATAKAEPRIQKAKRSKFRNLESMPATVTAHTLETSTEDRFGEVGAGPGPGPSSVSTGRRHQSARTSKRKQSDPGSSTGPSTASGSLMELGFLSLVESESPVSVNKASRSDTASDVGASRFRQEVELPFQKLSPFPLPPPTAAASQPTKPAKLRLTLGRQVAQQQHEQQHIATTPAPGSAGPSGVAFAEDDPLQNFWSPPVLSPLGGALNGASDHKLEEELPDLATVLEEHPDWDELL